MVATRQTMMLVAREVWIGPVLPMFRGSRVCFSETTQIASITPSTLETVAVELVRRIARSQCSWLNARLDGWIKPPLSRLLAQDHRGGQAPDRRIAGRRFATDGRLDPGWPTRGVWQGTNDDDDDAILASNDGTVVAVGISQNREGSTSNPRAMLKRFDDRGIPVSEVEDAEENWEIACALVDREGGLVIVGYTGAGYDEDGASHGYLGIIERFAPSVAGRQP